MFSSGNTNRIPTIRTDITGDDNVCKIPGNNILLKWSLILWLVFGIVIYIMDILLFTSTIKDLFRMPTDFIFLLAIINNISLIMAIFLKSCPVLIVSVLIDCILLVALPALIVEVAPNLLTYGSLMIAIILSIVYGVLYMQNPLQFYDYYSLSPANNSSLYPESLMTNTAQPRLSYAFTPSSSYLNINQPTPRYSCQF